MGIQPVGDVDLIRHAYVLPGEPGRGIGGALLEHLRALGAAGGCWSARGRPRSGRSASTPQRLRAGLARAQDAAAQAVLDIPERQIETSVVLANPPLGEGGA